MNVKAVIHASQAFSSIYDILSCINAHNENNETLDSKEFQRFFRHTGPLF
jgi:hypothetical protein